MIFGRSICVSHVLKIVDIYFRKGVSFFFDDFKLKYLHTIVVYIEYLNTCFLEGGKLFYYCHEGQTQIWYFRGVFFQEPVLFASSIKHNIMQGSPDASKEDFMKACQDGKLPVD